MSASPRSPLRPPRLRWLFAGALVGALIALASAGAAAGQEPEATVSPIGGGVSGYGVTEWINLILRLALVLIVIWFAIMAMRWWVRRMNGGMAGGSGHLQVVETRALGPNRSLQLVRLGNRAVLLGVTSERISSVLEIDDPLEVDRLTRPIAQDDSPTSFRDAVSRLGSLTKWRPVIERKRSAPAPRNRAPIGGRALATVPRRRGRWARVARRVIGLEDPPLRRAPTAAATRAAAPAGRAPRSIAAASAAAAEPPASRAARARSGYRQNQIAEAQRAIASVRAETPR